MLVYVLAVFALAAVSAYPLFVAFGRAEAAAGLSPVPYNAFVFRLLEAFALLGLWPLLRGVGLRGRRHWGYGSTGAAFAHELAVGLGWGVASLLLLVGVLLGLGIRVMNAEHGGGLDGLATDLLTAAIAGLVIALIEETWFRGALFSVLRARANVAYAAGGTALVYAGLHFVRPDLPVAASQAGWIATFEVIGASFGRFASPTIIGPFLALMAAGLFLALLRAHTDSIARAIGVHTGWVFVIKLAQRTSTSAAGSSWSVLATGYDGIIGYLAAAWFAAMCCAYYWLHMRSARRAGVHREMR